MCETKILVLDRIRYFLKIIYLVPSLSLLNFYSGDRNDIKQIIIKIRDKDKSEEIFFDEKEY